MMQNNIKDGFLGDDTGENETWGEAGRWKEHAGLRVFLSCFPCSFAWGTVLNAGVIFFFYGLEKTGCTARGEVGWI